MTEKTILEKLQLKPGRTMAILNPPAGYLEKAGTIPSGAAVTHDPVPSLIIQVFITSQQQLEEQFERLAPLVARDGMLWITYPKLTSKLKGEIHRDSINSYAQAHGWKGIAMIAVDENWSALRLKRL